MQPNVTVRLIVGNAVDGPTNMAMDEAILESVGAGESPPTARLYTFHPTCISVGRFQKTKGTMDYTALVRDGIDLVRRPSGGQAVLHADELTYCVVFGREHLENVGKRQMYRFIVPLLQRGLEKLGVRSNEPVSRRRGEYANPDCFASTGEYEIDDAGGRKLIGSAQMVSRSAILQHGSVPLSNAYRAIAKYLLYPPSDGELAPTSISEQRGAGVEFKDAQKAFAEAIHDTISAERGTFSESEKTRVIELYNTKYSRAEWNEKL